MARINDGVFDAGPLIHLSEIKQFSPLGLIKQKIISNEVESEIKNYGITIEEIKGLKIKNLSLTGKNLAKFIIERYFLGLGEATSIALAKQEKVDFFFTDDREAKETAKKLGLKAHGVLGLITKSVKEKIISKEKALEIIKLLSEKSSLFVTSDLIKWIENEIKQFKN